MKMAPAHRVEYASADGPELRIVGETIHGGLEIVAGPTYGRFLFRPTVHIADCVFSLADGV